MSFAERVQRKRTEQELERAQQWQRTLSAADAPAFVAKMASYEAALRDLSADLLGSLEFRALFGESSVVMVCRPGENFRGMDADRPMGEGVEGLQDCWNAEGRVVSMSFGDTAAANDSAPDYQLAVRLISVDADEVRCRLNVVQYDGVLRDEILFREVQASDFSVDSPSDMADKVGDLLADVVLRCTPARRENSISEDEEDSFVSSLPSVQPLPSEQPGLLGRLFGR